MVIYASRALTNVETRYSQTEREALGVVWACEHFNRFVKGAPRFTVISDHKPLEFIWQKARPPLWIERWGLRLQPYNMVIKYRPGADNPADYMSRHPARSNIIRSREQQMAEHYVNALASVATPMALTVDEVKRETAKDATLQVVIKLVQTNKWHDIAHYRDTEVSYECLLSFSKVRDTLTVNESADLLMRDYQIVIPNTLQKQHRLLQTPTSRRRRSRSVSQGDRHVFASRRNACLSTCRHYMYDALVIILVSCRHYIMTLVFQNCYDTCFVSHLFSILGGM